MPSPKILNQSFDNWLSDKCSNFGDDLNNVLKNLSSDQIDFLKSKYEKEKDQTFLRMEEANEKISLNNIWKGNKLPLDMKQRISESVKESYLKNPNLAKSRNYQSGKSLSPSTIQKISETLKNSKRVIPEEEKMRRTEGIRRYYANLSEEEREKMKTKKAKVLNEIKKRPEVVEKLKGMEVSKETRNKLSERLKGKKLSEEHVAKLREGQRRRHERDGRVKRKPYVSRCEKCKEMNRKSCVCWKKNEQKHLRILVEK